MPATPLLPVSMLDLQSLASADSLDRIYVWDASETKLKSMLVASIVGAAKRVVAPTSISADQNDYDPTGLSSADVLTLTVTADRMMTGIASSVDGRELVLRSSPSSTGVLSLSTQDSRSVAANRFRFGAIPFVVLLPGESVVLAYSSTDSGWILATPPFWVENKARQVITCLFDDDAWTGLQTSTANSGAVTRSSPYGDTSAANLSSGGSSASGRAGIGSKSMSMTAGNGGVRGCTGGCYSGNPSSGTQRYTTRVGILNSISAEPTRGAYFRFVENVNSGNVEAVFADGGGLTTADTGFALDGGGYVYFHFAVLLNVGGGYADYYISSGRTLSWSCRVTGTAFTDGCGFGASLIKSVGTTARNIDIFPMRHSLEVS